MKHHKKHRSPSPSDKVLERRKKHHKRHRSESVSDEDDHRKKHHKHRREKERHQQNHSGDEEIERESRRQRRHRQTEYDPNIRIKQEKDEENLEQQHRERAQNDHRRREHRRERDRNGGDYGLNTQVQIKSEEGEENKETKEEEKQKPNFELSGKLTEDTNTFRGVVIKYNEPQEAMKPKRRWRLYPFKGEESLPVLHIHRQSAYLLGRDRKIADIPVDHPSCSKQHAVLQFRAMPYTRPDGTPGRRVRPYIIDLESANGTYVNGEKMEPRRYYELREKDVVKFGFSSREYVVLHDSVDLSEVQDGHDMEEA